MAASVIMIDDASGKIQSLPIRSANQKATPKRQSQFREQLISGLTMKPNLSLISLRMKVPMARAMTKAWMYSAESRQR